MEYSINRFTKAHKRSNANRNEGLFVILCEMSLRGQFLSGRGFSDSPRFCLEKRKNKAGHGAQRCYEIDWTIKSQKVSHGPATQYFVHHD